MGYNCFVPQCNSATKKGDKSIKFHKFPSDKCILAEWKAVIRTGKLPSVHSKVCSKHFTDEDYKVTSMGEWKILKHTAVPSQCLPKRSHDKPPKENNGLERRRLEQDRQLQSEEIVNATAVMNFSTMYQHISLADATVKIEIEEHPINIKLEVDVGLDVEPDVNYNPDIDVEPDVEPDVKPAIDVEPDVEHAFDVEPDVNYNPDIDVKPDVEPDIDVEPVGPWNDIDPTYERHFVYLPEEQSSKSLSRTEDVLSKIRQEWDTFDDLEMTVEEDVDKSRLETPTQNPLGTSKSGQVEKQKISVRDYEDSDSDPEFFNGTTFECPYCQKTFPVANDLSQHFKTICGTLPLACGFCDMTFMLQSSLTDHLLIHRKQIQCIFCDSRFASQEQLSEHVKMRNSSWQCKICYQGFCSSLALTYHRLKDHRQKVSDLVASKQLQDYQISHPNFPLNTLKVNDNGLFQCTFRPRTFKEQYLFRNHLEAHGSDKIDACGTEALRDNVRNTSGELAKQSTCDRVEANGGSHLTCRIVNCPDCIKTFSKSEPISHVVKHSDKKFTCRAKNCKETFDTWLGLSYHHEQLHKIYKCCDAIFPSLAELKVHNRVHPFSCDVCGKIFNELRNLEDHAKSHGGMCSKSSVSAKPRIKNRVKMPAKLPPCKRITLYKCSSCNMTFNSITLLEAHLKTHSTKQKFLCKVCNSVFDNLSDWSKHASSHGL